MLMEPTSLRRTIGPAMLTLFVIGDILGSGVYVLIGEIAAPVGGALWAPFLIAFALAALTALSYAELVTRYPGAAGAALYTQKAFGIPFVTFLVAVGVLLNGVVAASVGAHGFASRYLDDLIDVPHVAATLTFLGVIALINYSGITGSVRFNAGITVITAAGLLAVVVVGAMAVLDGRGELSRLTQFDTGDKSVVVGLLSATALAFFAMIGFEDSVNIAEETRDPGRSYPVALLAGLGATALLYLAIAAVSGILVDPATLAHSNAPLLTVVESSGYDIPHQVLSVAALLAITNTVLLNMIMASRLMYGMAGQGVMPAIFRSVHPRHRTPWVAIIFTTGLALVLVTTAPIQDLARTGSLIVLVVFTIVNVCVLTVRRREVGHPHFRTPLACAVLGAGASFTFTTPLGGHSAAEYLRAVLLVGLGVLLWFGNRWFMRRDAGLPIDPDAQRQDLETSSSPD